MWGKWAQFITYYYYSFFFLNWQLDLARRGRTSGVDSPLRNDVAYWLDINGTMFIKLCLQWTLGLVHKGSRFEGRFVSVGVLQGVYPFFFPARLASGWGGSDGAIFRVRSVQVLTHPDSHPWWTEIFPPTPVSRARGLATDPCQTSYVAKTTSITHKMLPLILTSSEEFVR